MSFFHIAKDLITIVRFVHADADANDIIDLSENQLQLPGNLRHLGNSPDATNTINLYENQLVDKLWEPVDKQNHQNHLIHQSHQML